MGVAQIEGFRDTGQAGRAFVYNSAGQRVDSLGPSGSDSTRKESKVEFTGRKDSKGRLEVKYDVTDKKGNVTHRQGFVNANYVGAIRPDGKTNLSPAAQNITTNEPASDAAKRIAAAHQAAPTVPTAVGTLSANAWDADKRPVKSGLGGAEIKGGENELGFSIHSQWSFPEGGLIRRLSDTGQLQVAQVPANTTVFRNGVTGIMTAKNSTTNQVVALDFK